MGRNSTDSEEVYVMSQIYKTYDSIPCGCLYMEMNEHDSAFDAFMACRAFTSCLKDSICALCIPSNNHKELL